MRKGEAMTSDEKRREVAARLRVYSHDFDFDDSNPFWYVSKAAFGDVDIRPYYSVFARLADLIDRPTCRNVSGCQDTFECSECRCKVELIAEVCNEYGEPFGVPLMPSWCPNCGAEVLND